YTLRMRSKTIFALLCTAAILLATAGALVARQAAGKSSESKGTDEAKAWLGQAEAKLRGAPDYDSGIALLKKAIKADPYVVAACERLASPTRSAAIARANQTQVDSGDLIHAALADLKKQYATWAAADPKNAILAWAQGSLEDKDWAKAKTYYDRAIALD